MSLAREIRTSFPHFFGNRSFKAKEPIAPRVDKKDSRILRQLVSDSRTPIARIAAKVGLTDNGVRYRVRQLEDAGVIRGYTAVVDQGALGRPLAAVLRVRADPAAVSHLASKLGSSPLLSQVYVVAGAANIVAMGDFEGPDELRKFMRANLEGKGVQSVEVDLVTEAVHAGPRVP